MWRPKGCEVAARAGDSALARTLFARHVSTATLTPEVRREWYRRMMDPDPKAGNVEMYRLSILKDPPPDVGPAIAEAVKLHAKSSKTDDPVLQGLLNNGVTALETFQPPARPMRCWPSPPAAIATTSGGWRWEWLFAVDDPSLTDRIAGHLRDEDAALRVARRDCFAWVGDGRGEDVLIAAAAARPSGPQAVRAAAALAISARTPAPRCGRRWGQEMRSSLRR